MTAALIALFSSSPVHAGGRSAEAGSSIEVDGASVAAGPSRKRVVNLGVSADAEPFSYRAGPGNKRWRSFRGYTADLCYQLFDGSDAGSEFGYEVRLVPVDASNRFEKLRRVRPENEDWSSNKYIDVLCEATTLRYDNRMDKVSGIFSPLIFVSGVSYMMRASRLPYTNDIYVGFVKGTTAKYVVSQACKNDMFALYNKPSDNRKRCYIFLAQPNQRSAVYDPRCDFSRAAPRQQGDLGQYHLCSFTTHDELINWFCKLPDSELYAKIVYFGDREIIEAKLKSARARERCKDSKVEPPQVTYTYEPYALLISKVDPDLVQFVQRRVYEFFSHRSKATSLFATYFPGEEMSPVLAYLFLLNSVNEEKYFQVPDLEDPERHNLHSTTALPEP